MLKINITISLDILGQMSQLQSFVEELCHLFKIKKTYDFDEYV